MLEMHPDRSPNKPSCCNSLLVVISVSFFFGIDGILINETHDFPTIRPKVQLRLEAAGGLSFPMPEIGCNCFA